MMMGVRRRFACCTRDRKISIDIDENEHDRIMTYDGLESYIQNFQSYSNTFASGCLDEEETNCSSSKYAFGSFFSNWTSKRDNEEADEWGSPASPKDFGSRKKPAYTTKFSDVEAMKEKFAKLLLGEDVSGGRNGIGSALAISNAITNLAATIFGALWKLEPLPEERKMKWRKEMDWLVSPANYMVVLVPAKQSGTNGRIFEIMTPKARADVHMNLPALQKLDSILIEALDSMVGTEFWYAEGNSRGKGTVESNSWWLASPRVPAHGLSNTARQKLLSLGNLVHQVFKAAKSINENVLHEMPVPESARVCLGEELYKVIISDSGSAVEIVDSLKLKSEHEALDAINKLETATLALKERIKELQVSSNKTPLRTSWSFMKEPISEVDKIESLLFRVDDLMHELKIRYPCLPHTFIDVTKIRYGKDIGHSILEAYSRVLGNLAYSILSRIGDTLREDHSSNPSSPMPSCCFLKGLTSKGISGSPIVKPRIGHSLLDRMNKVDGYFSDSNPSRSPDSELSSSTDACKYNSSETATLALAKCRASPKTDATMVPQTVIKTLEV
ncbi:hypothetical protein Cgig2_021981 [Carnegiea gigantea]|uniref:PRONE domain-containing protein n=1 Tax=Carnegiea gigantea TaxID=171969 RepID=A0A9Q1KT12_9CARY|nr:hypothetical protein Cgig2_021981 [Carnegiea gigantea]